MSYELITTLTVFKRITKSGHEGAEYSRDENGVVITRVPGASGFFAQGDSFEEARENLRDAIEGNVILALQLGFEIPHLEGIEIKKRDVQTSVKNASPSLGSS